MEMKDEIRTAPRDRVYAALNDPDIESLQPAAGTDPPFRHRTGAKVVLEVVGEGEVRRQCHADNSQAPERGSLMGEGSGVAGFARRSGCRAGLQGGSASCCAKPRPISAARS